MANKRGNSSSFLKFVEECEEYNLKMMQSAARYRATSALQPSEDLGKNKKYQKLNLKASRKFIEKNLDKL